MVPMRIRIPAAANAANCHFRNDPGMADRYAALRALRNMRQPKKELTFNELSEGARGD